MENPVWRVFSPILAVAILASACSKEVSTPNNDSMLVDGKNLYATVVDLAAENDVDVHVLPNSQIFEIRSGSYTRVEYVEIESFNPDGKPDPVAAFRFHSAIGGNEDVFMYFSNDGAGGVYGYELEINEGKFEPKVDVAGQPIKAAKVEFDDSGDFSALILKAPDGLSEIKIDVKGLGIFDVAFGVGEAQAADEATSTPEPATLAPTEKPTERPAPTNTSEPTKMPEWQGWGAIPQPVEVVSEGIDLKLSAQADGEAILKEVLAAQINDVKEYIKEERPEIWGKLGTQLEGVTTSSKFGDRLKALELVLAETGGIIKIQPKIGSNAYQRIEVNANKGVGFKVIKTTVMPEDYFPLSGGVWALAFQIETKDARLVYSLAFNKDSPDWRAAVDFLGSRGTTEVEICAYKLAGLVSGDVTGMGVKNPFTPGISPVIEFGEFIRGYGQDSHTLDSGTEIYWAFLEER